MNSIGRVWDNFGFTRAGCCCRYGMVVALKLPRQSAVHEGLEKFDGALAIEFAVGPSE